MQNVNSPPFIPSGAIKTMGINGPKYEVGNALLQLEDGDWLVEVKLLLTGEKSELRLSRILEDPGNS
jgi:hypothetical protein